MSQTASNTQTSLAAHMRQCANYNQWANTRMAEWLRTKPADIFEQEVPSSFPSLKATITHICFVERGWLASLQNTEAPHAYGQVFEGPISELLDLFVKQSEDLGNYILSLSEADIQDLCHFKVPVRWPIWDDFSEPRFQVIQHCIAHGNYHRGQIVTIARNLGLTDPPMTDYMAYLLTA